MRIKTTITYEYDVDPEHYPDTAQTPSEMADFDIEADPAMLLQGTNYTVTAVEVADA